jgi:hypothetical protein
MVRATFDLQFVEVGHGLQVCLKGLRVMTLVAIELRERILRKISARTLYYHDKTIFLLCDISKLSATQ